MIRQFTIATGPKLNVTPRMIDVAKDNKAIGIVKMDPFEFLVLTTNIPVKDWIANERQDGHIRTLEEYNSYNLRLMPFLDVDRESGKVLEHEGRHRAAALIDAGGDEMEVAITLRDHQHKGKVYYEHPYPDDRERWLIKRFLNVDDVPQPFYGQFRSTRVTWSPRLFKEFYEAETAEVAAVWD